MLQTLAFYQTVRGLIFPLYSTFDKNIGASFFFISRSFFCCLVHVYVRIACRRSLQFLSASYPILIIWLPNLLIPKFDPPLIHSPRYSTTLIEARGQPASISLREYVSNHDSLFQRIKLLKKEPETPNSVQIFRSPKDVSVLILLVCVVFFPPYTFLLNVCIWRLRRIRQFAVRLSIVSFIFVFILRQESNRCQRARGEDVFRFCFSLLSFCQRSRSDFQSLKQK